MNVKKKIICLLIDIEKKWLVNLIDSNDELKLGQYDTIMRGFY